MIMLTGCDRRQTSSAMLLEGIGNLIDCSPKSALSKLDSISSHNLNGKSFAYRCMLYGKITDKLYISLLPAYQFERAGKWYLLYGTPEEQVQILLYLGRAYAEDGDYDKAMLAYTDALEIAHNNNLINSVGYINTYMGVLYEERGMREQAISKFKTAAESFKEANNVNSYICALRDVGREYARIDSFSYAQLVLFKADSIATNIDNKAVKASLINTIGDIYLLQQKYDKAKACYYNALLLGINKMPNYMGLIKVYIETDSLDKAKELLQNMPLDNPKYKYSIKRYYSLVYRQEKQYEDALNNLEEYIYLMDSIVKADNQSKILNIEKKYNDLRNQKIINDLIISRQTYVIILSICLLVMSLMVITYMFYRKHVKQRIQKQQMELHEFRTKLLNLSLDLEKKKIGLLILEEKVKDYNKVKEETAGIIFKYKKLQSKMIIDSPLYKELVRLASQHVPKSEQCFITEKQWELIVKEIIGIYPNLPSYIMDLCPELSDQEWRYCCFSMLGFDTNSEAQLLNINLSSVRTKRLRLRQKLNVSLPARVSFQEYISEKLVYEYKLRPNG